MELLIVIAVVAVLAALLIPAVLHAKGSCQAAVCVNNLRQLALGSALYSVDNEGHLPFFLNWLSTQQGDLTSGRLFSYLGKKTVYVCPTDKRALDSGARAPLPGTDNFLRDFSYGMNCVLCHDSDPSTFISPCRTLFMMEPEWPPFWSRSRLDDPAGVIGPQTLRLRLPQRHNRRAHLLFSDMHIESLRPERAKALQKTLWFWFPTANLTTTSLTNLAALSE